MSGPEWLIDTNVVIGLLKGHEPAVRLAEDVQLDLNRSAVSQITRMELLGFPLLAEAEAFQITNFLACCQVHLLDEQIEAQAIQLRRLSGLKLPDAIIAATSIVKNLELLTLDSDLLDRTLKYRGQTL
jgi:hypothetical protein